MARATTLVLLTLVMLSACARRTDEQRLIDDAAAALGGAGRLLAVKTLVIDGQGTQYNLGQDVAPGASGQTWAVTEYTRAIDVPAQRARTELVRLPKFTYWQGLAAQRQVQGIDRAVGYNVNANGAASRVAQTAADDRRAELLRHPVTAVRAALDPAARLTNVRNEGSESRIDVVTADGQSFTLALDASTKLPTRVSTAGSHPNLGDVVVSTTFSDYQNVNGLQLPARLTTKTDAFTTTDVRVTRQTVDAEAGDLAAPAAAASAAPPTPQPPTVTVEEVSPGVWLLAGGSHHSAVVEFSDHLLLIEAPLNEARTLAVIAKARELRPGKPLTHVVNSHHHFDHSGGVRAAISEGLTVITHEGNVAFFEEMIKRPHTRVPDALAKNPKPLRIEAVGAERVITDGAVMVRLYSIPGEHSETMLMAYLPRERALVVIDVYEPGRPPHMFLRPFIEDLKKRNLRVERIVPLHEKIVSYEHMIKEMG